jgi:hypothetical protein
MMSCATFGSPCCHPRRLHSFVEVLCSCCAELAEEAPSQYYQSDLTAIQIARLALFISDQTVHLLINKQSVIQRG